MIVVMKEQASKRDVDYVVARSHSLGFMTHVARDARRVMVSLLGDVQNLEPAALSGLPGVERVISSEHAFRLASIESMQERTIINVDGIEIGAEGVVIIAGPCAVESYEQLLEAAWAVKEAGAHMLRGGAYKPRTSPYTFQGMGEDGLEILARAKQETGLPIVTEVMAPDQVAIVSRYADVLQIGTRSMQNYALLHEVGESGKPVLLKRGMMSTIFELLMSAEYILSHDNRDVILCERGIRTFETYSRNTLDINAVPLLKELTHLPVVVDPSHATGKASLVPAVAKSAVAAGADGLLIEVHPDPDRALSDGYQSLRPTDFGRLVQDLERVAAAVDRRVLREADLEDQRQAIAPA